MDCLGGFCVDIQSDSETDIGHLHSVLVLFPLLSMGQIYLTFNCLTPQVQIKKKHTV